VIIQVSILGGRIGSPGLGAYQSAKRALGGFSTVLASEVAPLGIKMTVAVLSAPVVLAGYPGRAWRVQAWAAA
jgi:NAD(P)-dependent dehydrogenase (short-subunit alcohol dehydrogenase family)